MAFQSRLISTLQKLRNKQKTRTLLNRTDEVFRNYLLAFEDVVDARVTWIDRLAFSLSEERLQRFMNKERSLRTILYTTFNYEGYWVYRSICPQQIQTEIEQLAREVEKLSPSTILEIGTSNGGTLYVWARYIKSCHRIISIDLPEGYPCAKIKFFELFDKAKEFCFLRGNSHSEKTVDMFTQVLKQWKIDFLYIDGDHSYEGVKQDFKTYVQFVAPGGIVAFHDILYHHNYGVDKFWNEIKCQYASREIVASRNQSGYGIGILYI